MEKPAEEKTKMPVKDTALSVVDKPIRTKEWYNLDVYMLPAKFAYFFQLSKDFSYQPYLVLFLTGIGLSVPEAGLIAGVRLVGIIIGSPFWGFVTDKRNNHRTVILLLCVLSALLMCSQPFLGLIGGSETNVCPEPTEKTLPMNHEPFCNKIFFIMLVTNIAASFVDGSTMGMIDAGVINRIKMASEPKDFGWNRLFGAFGFAAGSLISGLVVQNFPTLNVTCYSGIFVVYFASTMGLLISGWFLFNMKQAKCVNKNEDDQEGIASSLLVTLKGADVIIFLFTVFLVGTQQGVFVYFTTVTLKQLGASNVVQALTISSAGISCIFSIALSTRLIQLFRGTWNTLIISGASFIVRFLIFANISNPVYAIPTSFFQAFGLGLFISASVSHVRFFAPEKLRTTLYGLMNSMYFGAGFITASVAGSILFEKYGSRVLFTSSAILMAIWTVFLIIYKIVDAHKNKNNKKEINPVVIENRETVA